MKQSKDVNELQKELETYLTEGTNELDEKYQAVQILPELNKRYPGKIPKSVLSVRFYQTYEACYLEVTRIHPDHKKHMMQSEFPEGSYSRMGFITERESLGYMSDDEAVAFNPENDIISNVCNLLSESMDDTKIDLFNISIDGDDDTYDDFDDKYYEDVVPEPGDPDDGNFGERTYSGEELNSAPNFYSLLDEDRLETGTLHWSVIEGICVIEMFENLQYKTNDPFKGVKLKEGLVDMEVIGERNGKDYVLKIPVKQISRILVNSEQYAFSGEYNGPETYTFRIDFISGEALSIKGDFILYVPEGKSLPEAGYYQHKAVYLSQD